MIIKTPQFSTLPKLFLNSAKIVVMYISIFLLFFLDSGFYPVQNLSGTIILLINIAAILGLVITSGEILKINKISACSSSKNREKFREMLKDKMKYQSHTHTNLGLQTQTGFQILLHAGQLLV